MAIMPKAYHLKIVIFLVKWRKNKKEIGHNALKCSRVSDYTKYITTWARCIMQLICIKVNKNMISAL